MDVDGYIRRRSDLFHALPGRTGFDPSEFCTQTDETATGFHSLDVGDIARQRTIATHRCTFHN